MCGVIGAVIPDCSYDDLALLRKLFLESSIRGLHATGVAYVKRGQVLYFREAIPANQFLEKYDLSDCIDQNGTLHLIGHCRYSTSDLEFNQPMVSPDLALVHNGVVTQDPRNNWETMFDLVTLGGNDSELLLRGLVDKGKSPLELFPDASLAVVELHRDKTLRFYRNGLRPLYFANLPNSLGCVVASTADILHRSGVDDVLPTTQNVCYTFEQEELTYTVYGTNKRDLQP